MLRLSLGFDVPFLGTHRPCLQVCVLFNFDPKLASVPYWLLNFVSEKFCVFLIRFMRSAVAKVTDPSSEFARRIVENKLVYDEIKRRVLMYIGETKAREFGIKL